MEYFKYACEELFTNGITYVEAKEGRALRQVTSNGKEYVASNFKHPRWGFNLADQRVDYEAFEEITLISQQEFDDVWKAHLAQHRQSWETTKFNYPIGTQVTGAIAIFYPQGVLIDLNEGSPGITDYAQCRASAKPEWMSPKHKVTGIVAGYDEDNFWVRLHEPQVHEEMIYKPSD